MAGMDLNGYHFVRATAEWDGLQHMFLGDDAGYIVRHEYDCCNTCLDKEEAIREAEYLAQQDGTAN